MEFKRARNDEQKNIRIQQIIDATLELLETQPFDKITFKAIADKLEFSRINMYKYVTTKEEIFLLVFARDLENWVTLIEKEFGETPASDPEDFLRRWAASIYGHKRLLDWLTLLNIVIEQNVSLDALVTFKKTFFELYARIYPIISTNLPDLPKEEIEHFLAFEIEYATGLYSMTETTQIQKKAIEICGCNLPVFDFIEEYVRMSLYTIAGISTKKSTD